MNGPIIIILLIILYNNNNIDELLVNYEIAMNEECILTPSFDIFIMGLKCISIYNIYYKNIYIYIYIYNIYYFTFTLSINIVYNNILK